MFGKVVLGALIFGLFLWAGYLAVYGIAWSLHYLVYRESPSVTEEMRQELTSYTCQLAAPVFDSILISRRIRVDSDEAERRAKIWVSRFPERLEKFPKHVREFRFAAVDQGIMDVAESRVMLFLAAAFRDQSAQTNAGDEETVSATLVARAQCLEDVRGIIGGWVRLETRFDRFVKR